MDAAAERLAARGPEELSLRALAASQGTSTNAIYSIFGGKGELIAAVVTAADASFYDAQMNALTEPLTLESLLVLGAAYREWALDHPALYRVMFGGDVRRTTSGDAAPPVNTKEPLIRVVSQLMAAGVLRDQDIELVCRSVWAAVHGWVMLEVTGITPETADAAARFRAMQEVLLVGLAEPAAVS